MSARRATLALAGLLAAGADGAAAQGVAFQVGRLFDDGGWTSFGVRWVRPIMGPLSAEFGGIYLRAPASRSAGLFGATVDASLFRGGVPGVYAVGGLSGGFGTGGSSGLWSGWSAGAGYEITPLPFLSLAVEGRWRELAPSGRGGPELSVRLGANLGRAPKLPAGTVPPALPAALPAGRSTADRGTRDAPPTEAPPSGAPAADASSTPVALAIPTVRGRPLRRADADSLLGEVIRTSEDAMGTRYQFGGRGVAGEGFDCSGLIQFAYARHGVALPRVSVDQARQGREIGRRRDRLAPGDILTFSSDGGPITHVGLYIGDGRFIHSASKGVQVSLLTASDPQGKWWFMRWIGARRIVE